MQGDQTLARAIMDAIPVTAPRPAIPADQLALLLWLRGLDANDHTTRIKDIVSALGIGQAYASILVAKVEKLKFIKVERVGRESRVWISRLGLQHLARCRSAGRRGDGVIEFDLDVRPVVP